MGKRMPLVFFKGFSISFMIFCWLFCEVESISLFDLFLLRDVPEGVMNAIYLRLRIFKIINIAIFSLLLNFLHLILNLLNFLAKILSSPCIFLDFFIHSWQSCIFQAFQKLNNFFFADNLREDFFGLCSENIAVINSKDKSLFNFLN